MKQLPMILAVVAGATIGIAAQQPAPQPPATPPVEAAEPPPQPAFTYDPAGRRDPFISLVGRGVTPDASGTRPAGLPGMLIHEVSLKGIMKERSGFVALVQGTDRKSYTIRQGQRLLDGAVKSITADAVIFAQDINDPLSAVKQKEVRKSLRSAEEDRG